MGSCEEAHQVPHAQAIREQPQGETAGPSERSWVKLRASGTRQGLLGDSADPLALTSHGSE